MNNLSRTRYERWAWGWGDGGGAWVHSQVHWAWCCVVGSSSRSEAGGVKDDENHVALDPLSLLRELGHHLLHAATKCPMGPGKRLHMLGRRGFATTSGNCVTSSSARSGTECV